jgi:RNA polymerase sigma-70 factor (sigma-E family)
MPPVFQTPAPGDAPAASEIEDRAYASETRVNPSTMIERALYEVDMSRRDTEGEFAAFVAQSSPTMLRVAFLLTGQQSAAEDLLQASLERLYVVWDRLDTDTPPTQYLRRILYTTYISSWRRRLREVLTASPPEHMEQRDAYAEHDDRDRLWRLVQRLAPMQRSVIVLRFYEDLSEAETAQILRISPGSVKVHASRGVRRLRSMAYPADHRPTGSGVML